MKEMNWDERLEFIRQIEDTINNKRAYKTKLHNIISTIYQKGKDVGAVKEKNKLNNKLSVLVESFSNDT